MPSSCLSEKGAFAFQRQKHAKHQAFEFSYYHYGKSTPVILTDTNPDYLRRRDNTRVSIPALARWNKKIVSR